MIGSPTPGKGMQTVSEFRKGFQNRAAHMNSKSNQNRILLKWMRIVVWGILAVFLSRQNGFHTSALSYRISEIIRRFLESCGVPIELREINYALRILAHLIIYLVLGGLVFDTISCTIQKSKKTALSLSVLFCLIASVLDEAQKFFIPGRHCDIADIALNTVAAVVGIFAVFFLSRNREA